MEAKNTNSPMEKRYTETDASRVNFDRHVSNGVFIRKGESYFKVQYTDILWVNAYNNYCELHLKGGQTFCAIHPLVRLEKLLPQHLFVRTHRSYIVNIHEVSRFMGNMLYIGQQKLDVSRPYRKAVFSCFDILEDTTKKPPTQE